MVTVIKCTMEPLLMEPLLMDTLYKGHNGKISIIITKDNLMVSNVEFHISKKHYEPAKRGHPLYKGQDAWSHGALI